MITSINSIARKTVYRVTFDNLTIDGSVTAGTKWYNELSEIPSKYLNETNCKLWKRSFNKFKMPSFEQMKHFVKTNNRYWLDLDEVIVELVMADYSKQ